MKELWACLAAMAVFGNDLNTAEVAYAEIQEVKYFFQLYLFKIAGKSTIYLLYSGYSK